MFKDSDVLITGGSGSWGTELTKQLLERDIGKVIILSRGELAQVVMRRKFNDERIHFVIGDVRDYSALDRLLGNHKVDYIFHMAALKHVDVCENHPQEVIKTNIQGTTNLVNAAIKYKIKKVIDVSTDKAVSPTNLYGYTKAVGEKLCIQANNLTKDTDFVCIRGGNVLGSNGSVVPLFVDQIKNDNQITVTVGTMTRFFLTLPEAIHLLFHASETSVGGETYVLNMPSFFINTLAEVLIEHYGNDTTSIKEIGIREGEKLNELLVSEHESPRTYVYDENYYVIKPELDIDRDYSHLDMLSKSQFTQFSSADQPKTFNYLRGLLDRGGFLV